MLDKDRISKSKADILSMQLQIEEITGMGKETFLLDKRNPLSLKYLLIEAVEAITEVCQHILARAKGVSCSGYIDCIVKAGENGIITPPLSSKLRRLADLRNSLIHRYWIINDEELYNIDGFVKSPFHLIFVIPAKAGIQLIQAVLDSCFRRSDGFGTFYGFIIIRSKKDKRASEDLGRQNY